MLLTFIVIVYLKHLTHIFQNNNSFELTNFDIMLKDFSN